MKLLKVIFLAKYPAEQITSFSCSSGFALVLPAVLLERVRLLYDSIIRLELYTLKQWCLTRVLASLLMVSAELGILSRSHIRTALNSSFSPPLPPSLHGHIDPIEGRQQQLEHGASQDLEQPHSLSSVPYNYHYSYFTVITSLMAPRIISRNDTKNRKVPTTSYKGINCIPMMYYHHLGLGPHSQTPLPLLVLASAGQLCHLCQVCPVGPLAVL